MKVYRLDYDEPGGDGWRVAWAGSLAEAARSRADIRRTTGVNVLIKTTPVEIPTTRQGLLIWLQTYMTSDGG